MSASTWEAAPTSTPDPVPEVPNGPLVKVFSNGRYVVRPASDYTVAASTKPLPPAPTKASVSSPEQ